MLCSKTTCGCPQPGWLADKEAADWTFQHSDGSWQGDLEAAQASTNSMGLGPDGANWKTTNTYSVDGVLYMFVMRCTYPSGSSDPQRRHIWQNSSIIKSTDNGRTWVRSPEGGVERLAGQQRQIVVGGQGVTADELH